MAVTKKQIAQQAGVSRSLVSQVLNDYPGVRVSPDTRRQILEVADGLGYRAKPVSREKSQAMILIVGDRSRHPWYLNLIQMADEIAQRRGLDLVVRTASDTEAVVGLDARPIAIEKTQYIILSGNLNQQRVEHLTQLPVPIIVAGTYDIDTASQVSWDCHSTVLPIVKHLAELGHRHIALFNGTLEYYTHRQVLDGFVDAHKSLGIPLNRELLQVSESENGFELVERCRGLGLQPTAVICANDPIAITAIAAFRRHGLEVPEDVSVVGRGSYEIGEQHHPPVTSLGMDRAAFIHGLEKLIDAHLRHPAITPQHITIPYELIVRQSTARCPASVENASL